MRILIIGDHPKTIGGVTNYTRPLSIELSKTHEVFYLYSGAFTFNFDMLKMRIEEFKNFPTFRSFELINGLGLEKNYDTLSIDTSNWADKLFRQFIIENRIEIIHINEIFGFSSNIINVAKEEGIHVIVTIHEYWWLCPHRVMVDFNNKICPGPENMQKCSFCIQKKLNGFNSRYYIQKIKIRKSLPFIFNILSKVNNFRKSFRKEELPKNIDLEFGNLTYHHFKNLKLENHLQKRLANNINALNSANLVIGVSNDVKDILIRYGVDSEKILVQHIGSTIAERKIEHIKQVDASNIVFGFIGGIGYYKGVHQLIDAFSSMPENYKEKCVLELYGQYNSNYVDSINDKILKNELYSGKVRFHGKYLPEDIQSISNSIDIMVLPSLCADTAPQTIFESFSCELPIIAPKVGGFPDFIKDNINGLLYDEASVKGLKEKLMYIIDNPNVITKYRSQIPKLKTISENCLELNELYKSFNI